MKGYKSNIESETLENTNFRKVLYSGKNLQLVLMNLKVGEEIGEETHHENDQFFRFESGMGKCFIDGNEYSVTDGDALIIPAGAKHNIINADQEKELQMYTIYAPPHHKDGILRATKAEAEDPENEEEFDGVTSELNPNDGSHNEINKLQNIITAKIDSVKSKSVKRKLAKSAKCIAKFENKIDKLKEKMAKLHQGK
jgi:mannose-6-phosphate isomerase-like protein (cupin superfamily)